MTARSQIDARSVRLGTIALLVAALMTAAMAQAEGEKSFPPDQLEQLVAPIALYPDPLLMNILIASTYPLEVAQAERWIGSKANLRGAELDKALEAQTWDASVESLTHFPDVLSRMSKNLDWTSDLGDAFLAQQADVLDAVQRMRKRADDQGNLKTTKEQKVVVEQQAIRIEAASPEVIYVPTYSAPAVYGPAWSYPTYYYPPMYAYPPGYVATASLVSFGVGMAVGAAVWGSCDWHGGGVYWGGGDVNIDVDRNVNRNVNRNVDREKWQHKPEHRRGVDYRNQNVRERYRGQDSQRRQMSRDQARGFEQRGGGVDQAAARARQSGGTARDGSRQGARDAQRASGGERRGSGASAFGGSGSGSFERAASARGSASRGGYGGRGGGGFGGGGGRGGGGRGGRR